ncbi:peptidase inhibitor family I36 protein [Plantactinospora sonchi]|uniref:Peptidase inhibitor family I36 protein n=1 Tax=Plantactinospora sonchi TaxID=1544735 RepID=A0ABU7S0K7_9ACTN
MGNHSIRRTISRFMVPLAVAVLAGGAIATPATAAPSAANTAATDTCDLFRALCLFEGAGHTGARFTVSALNPDVGTCVDLVEHGWADRAHSSVNTNSRAATLFPNDDCTGRPLLLSGSNPGFSFPGKSVFVY